MTKEQAHQELTTSLANLREMIEHFDGAMFHDVYTTLNIVDEMHANIYRLKSKRKWEKAIDTVSRMSNLIMDKELKEAVQSTISKYQEIQI